MNSKTLTDQFIDETYKGVLHCQGDELPPTGVVDIYDGNGNKTPISLGKDGNGVEIRTPLKIGTLDYPKDNSGTAVGSLLTQTEQNKLELKNSYTVYMEVVNLIYPVGSIFLSFNNVNPSVRFANTTWVQVSQGRFLVGTGNGDDGVTSKSFVSGNNYGEYGHRLTIAELPAHNHLPNEDPFGYPYYVTFNNLGIISRQEAGGDSNASFSFPNTRPRAQTMEFVGSNQLHNNTPPGYGVYVWRRTS